MVALEIMPDQVHLLVEAHRSASPSRIASLFKGITSRRLRAGFPHLRPGRPVLWSRSYCAAAVGAVPAQAVCGQISTRHGRPWRKERAR
jgi:putative transposase